jgi:RNA polymerase sigma-70 factor, ECF subfamily
MIPGAARRLCYGWRTAGVSDAEGVAGPTEEALVAGLQRRDPSACEAIVRTHGPVLLALTRRILRHEEDARDAVQDAFLSAFRSADRFAGAARLSTWLHRIAVNAALMKMRARRRRPEESIEDLLPGFLEDGHHVCPPDEWTAAPDALLQTRENRDFIRGCIDRLPEEYRTVLVLRDIEELDTEEAARALDLTVAAVKTRLHRARQALRGLLAERFEMVRP